MQAGGATGGAQWWRAKVTTILRGGVGGPRALLNFGFPQVFEFGLSQLDPSRGLGFGRLSPDNFVPIHPTTVADRGDWTLTFERIATANFKHFVTGVPVYKVQTNFHGSPQNFKQVFTENTGVSVNQLIVKAKCTILRSKYLMSDLLSGRLGRTNLKNHGEIIMPLEGKIPRIWS